MDIFGKLKRDLSRKRGDGSMKQNPLAQTSGIIPTIVIKDSESMAGRTWRAAILETDYKVDRNFISAELVTETLHASDAMPSGQRLHEILKPYLWKTSSSRWRGFPNTTPNDDYRSRTIFHTQSLYINPKALTFLTAFALPPIIQAAPQHISTTWGIPISNTLGVGTGLAISVFDDGANTNPVLYWTVYGSWSLSALLVVLFTTFSIKKSSRLRYLCNFALIQFLLTIVIAVSSIGEEGFVAKHLKQWTPLATIAIAGALTVGFERVA